MFDNGVQSKMSMRCGVDWTRIRAIKPLGLSDLNGVARIDYGESALSDSNAEPKKLAGTQVRSPHGQPFQTERLHDTIAQMTDFTPVSRDEIQAEIRVATRGLEITPMTDKTSELPITDHALEAWRGVYTMSPKESKWFHEAVYARIQSDKAVIEHCETAVESLRKRVLELEEFNDKKVCRYDRKVEFTTPDGTTIDWAHVGPISDARLQEVYHVIMDPSAPDVFGGIDFDMRQMAERIHADAVVIKRFDAAVAELLDAMEMQERRETEEFHIPQPVAKDIWDQAKKNGLGARVALMAEHYARMPK